MKRAREERRGRVRGGNALTGERRAAGHRQEMGWPRISSSGGRGGEGGKLPTTSAVLASVAPLSTGSPACSAAAETAPTRTMFESDLISGSRLSMAV